MFSQGCSSLDSFSFFSPQFDLILLLVCFTVKAQEEIGRRFVTAIKVNIMVDSLIVNGKTADKEWFQFMTRGPEICFLPLPKYRISQFQRDKVL